MRITWSTYPSPVGVPHKVLGWREQVEQEVRQGLLSGSSRQEIIRRVAQKMYQQDARDLGPLVDLGLFAWEIYLGDAELTVDWLLQQQPAPDPRVQRNQGVDD